MARWLAGWRARHRDRAIGPLYLNDARSVVPRLSPFSCSTTRATEQRCLSRISGQARPTAVYPLVAGTRETAGDVALEMIDLSPEPPYAYLVAIDSLFSLFLFFFFPLLFLFSSSFVSFHLSPALLSFVPPRSGIPCVVYARRFYQSSCCSIEFSVSSTTDPGNLGRVHGPRG